MSASRLLYPRSLQKTVLLTLLDKIESFCLIFFVDKRQTRVFVDIYQKELYQKIINELFSFDLTY